MLAKAEALADAGQRRRTGPSARVETARAASVAMPPQPFHCEAVAVFQQVLAEDRFVQPDQTTWTQTVLSHQAVQQRILVNDQQVGMHRCWLALLTIMSERAFWMRCLLAC